MKFTLGPLVAFLVATGCGPIVNLGVELKRLAREPETLAVFYPPRLPMMVVTRDSSVSASKELGARWTREYSLEDPAVRVKERVVAALRREASVQNMKMAPAVAPTDEVDALRKSFAARPSSTSRPSRGRSGPTRTSRAATSSPIAPACAWCVWTSRS